MDYSPTILLMPHNYLEWKPKILLLLRSRGLYQITMETEVEPDSVDEKNDFLNRQDMALRLICISISPELQYHVEEESLSTLDELWTRLEVLFGNKEDCEDCMQKVDKIEPTENPLEDQASQFEEPSTQVSAHIFVPFIGDDVYSISDLFSESHVEDIMHASQEPHVDTFSCTMHASQEPHAETPMHASQEPHACTCMHHACISGAKKGGCTSDSLLTLSEKNL
jgi:hypothetical protein